MYIVITGAVGFIASALVAKLNKEGYHNLILVDDFSEEHTNNNLIDKKYARKIDRTIFLAWFEQHGAEIEYVYHLGARTDTVESDTALFDRLNLNYSKVVWNICCQYNIPLLYASSAATYGLGEHGYEDSHTVASKLKPLNAYGWSKQNFDLWVLAQDSTPPLWAGIKFFNVYGPNEYHKSRMASVVMHCFKQVKASGKMKLFRSHKEGVENGHQSRDFIYVKDVVDVLYFMKSEKFNNNGLYNLGTGTARTFLDLVKSTFKAMDIREDISFIDTPLDIRDNYQYFTEATMDKLRNAGYNTPFKSLEEGVEDYVQSYLMKGEIF